MVKMVRPLLLLTTQPIVQVMCLYMAFIYGVMYLMLATFPDLWTRRYGEPLDLAGLNYISLGLGFAIGTQICAPANDRIYRFFKQNGHEGLPEFRLPLLFLGSILVPGGLVLYGWTAQKHLYWIVPNVGAFVYAIGNMICFLCVQTYVIDTYSKSNFAASALATLAFTRSLGGFAFPVFVAPYMFGALDYGWGCSVLAFVAAGVGLIVPLSMWLYGAKLRSKSSYAR